MGALLFVNNREQEVGIARSTVVTRLCVVYPFAVVAGYSFADQNTDIINLFPFC